ncbi:MAG: SDR family NAD(P)-dependent oxidoreductase [Anaerolineae bacterium]|nr:SDR family NAD(P)-dependent oxidoreductase [Anaerolineae bacterium]
MTKKYLAKESHLDNLGLRAGEYALITGGSQGLGRAFAEVLARHAINLILVALPASGLAEAALSLSRQYDVQTRYIETDLAADGGVEAVARIITQEKLPVSVLINNAGTSYNCRFEDSTIDENEACILLNTLAVVKMTHFLLPYLKQCHRAYILNVSSMAAFFPMPYMPVYAPTKAFILNFSLALRQELNHTPVRVSVLCPNGIRTCRRSTDKIKAFGWIGRLTSMEADDVADYTIQKMLEGQAVIIPGIINRAIRLVGHYAPQAWVYAVVSALYSRTARGGKAKIAPLSSVTGE